MTTSAVLHDDDWKIITQIRTATATTTIRTATTLSAITATTTTKCSRRFYWHSLKVGFNIFATQLLSAETEQLVV